MAKNDKPVKEVKTTEKAKQRSAKGKKIKKYFRELRSEFKRITWPTKETVFKNTVATLVTCVIVGTMVTLVDLGLAAILNLVIK